MKAQSLPCSEKTLYKIANLTAGHLKKHLADFTSFSPSYTVDTVATIKTKLTEAKSIPSGSTRTKDQIAARYALVKSAKACIAKWKTLKAYIQKAYKDDALDTMLNAAGALYTNDATKSYWEKTTAKMEAGVAFLIENGAEMVANKVMPAAFIDEFKTVAVDYEAKLANYQAQLENAQQIVVDNKKANIELYDILTPVFADGKIIYSDNEDKRQLFTFDYLIKLVEGKSTVPVKKPELTQPVVDKQLTEGGNVVQN